MKGKFGPERTPPGPRFWAKVDKGAGDNNACWLWTAKRNALGYGQFSDRDLPTVMANRLAWLFVCGPIPDGLNVLHRCDNPPCCNPAHLFLGTPGDNARDRDAKRRGANSRKTHCKRGHDLSAPENLWSNKHGKRECKVCANERRAALPRRQGKPEKPWLLGRTSPVRRALQHSEAA